MGLSAAIDRSPPLRLPAYCGGGLSVLGLVPPPRVGPVRYHGHPLNTVT
jgi:hypothetical protein